MGASIHLPSKRKVRSDRQKEITLPIQAHWVGGFEIAFVLHGGKTKSVDLLPWFKNYIKADNLIYLQPDRFRKFKLKDGMIYWGRNEDVAFRVSDLLMKANRSEEEILYII
ncbi:MAG: hypothetical protein ACOYXA_04085 [Bacteroidota bacterium]